ncbi:MAG: hypothetical protein D8M58_05220 [Calditrichaeota bacterium]|nr:MAG: hypothetical protein DWQ03_21285 [Calditrichota bacterium]MBL1204775.1 hypothetical protein [Calditrichota bacterium]NOG44604.1 tetratricopeptide repeat protein [Calditrichota bacterium]
MNEQLYSRAEILIQQNRFDEADKLLSELIGQDPNNFHLLAMSSQVALELGKNNKAQDLINNAISQAPDEDYLHFIKGRVMLRLDKYDEAEQSLNVAINLNAGDADYFAMWASIKLERKQFDSALDLANNALGLDSENILALNIRSTAQLKLNKKDASFETIEDALKEDPNNAYTHANYGWNLLEKGDHKKALVHFSEALKNDPNFEFAQRGMIEALKARYIFYRLFLKYSFFMSNLTAKYQWGVIIGFYFAYRIINKISQNNESLQPFLTPVLILMAVLAFSTWVMRPISNLFLRLNKYGKHLLDKDEIISSNFVGFSFLAFLGGLALYIFSGESKWISIAVFGFAMMVPFSVMFASSRYKYALPAYAGVMFIVGLLAISNAFSTGVLFGGWATIFLLGFIAFQLIANFIMIKEDNV